MQTGITLEDAIALMAATMPPLGTELLTPMDALGRTLATDIAAPRDNPPFDRSPLDGYALCASDSTHASREHPVTLRVIDTIYAGDVATLPVTPGTAVRIMTGAMLPPGCDCVIRQEDTNLGYPLVEIYQPLTPHTNYCYRGEDFLSGGILLPAGTPVDAAVVGVLASAGLTSVAVYKRPSVAVLSTGDEVVAPSVRPLPPGKIYDSNCAFLMARLRGLFMPVVHGEQAGDNPQVVADALDRLLAQYDLVITTGGVSVGDRDIFHAALPLLGATRHFWRVALKPGTPLMFSTYRGKAILSLSGNPFAAAATFEVVARPLLSILSGERGLRPVYCTATLHDSFPKLSPDRRFLRARHENGQVFLPEAHASGVLSSLVGCNCLVDTPAGAGALVAGQTVSILLL